MEQFPGDLKADGRLSRPCGQGEQDAVFFVRNSLQNTRNGVLLVVPRLPCPALVLKGHTEQFVPPFIGLGKRGIVQLLRGRKAVHFLLLPQLHVDAVNLQPVGRIGETDLHALGVILGLSHTFGVREVTLFGLNHPNVAVAVLQHVVGRQVELR